MATVTSVGAGGAALQATGNVAVGVAPGGTVAVGAKNTG